jgi:hypothetical protein
MKTTAVTVTAAAALVILAAPPAGAATPQVERVTESGTFAFCGFEIAFDLTGTFVRQTREPRAVGEPDRVTVVDDVRTTYTANGRTVTAERTVRVRTLSVTLVEGEDSLYEVVQLVTGIGFLYRDGNGDVIVRDAGMTKESYLLETFGDDDPDNDMAIPGPPNVIEQHGIHPDVDFCTDIAPFLQ